MTRDRRYKMHHAERRKKFKAMRPWSCVTGKLPFLSRRAARRKGKELTLQFGSVFEPYLCDRCERWHVGRHNETQIEAERSAIVRRFYGIPE